MDSTKPHFTYFWLTGKREVLWGDDAADALNKAGYGNGALSALDFFAPGDDQSWQWDEVKRKWIKSEGVVQAIAMDKTPYSESLQDLLAALHLLLSMDNDGELLSANQHGLMNELIKVREKFEATINETLNSDRPIN